MGHSASVNRAWDLIHREKAKGYPVVPIPAERRNKRRDDNRSWSDASPTRQNRVNETEPPLIGREVLSTIGGGVILCAMTRKMPLFFITTKSESAHVVDTYGGYAGLRSQVERVVAEQGLPMNVEVKLSGFKPLRPGTPVSGQVSHASMAENLDWINTFRYHLGLKPRAIEVPNIIPIALLPSTTKNDLDRVIDMPLHFGSPIVRNPSKEPL